MKIINPDLTDISYDNKEDGSWFDRDGTFQSSYSGQGLRPVYDGNGYISGVLSEPGSAENLILQTTDYTNATWLTPVNTGSRVFLTGPSGINSVQFIASSQRPYLAQNINLSASTEYTFSCKVEALSDIGGDGVVASISGYSDYSGENGVRASAADSSGYISFTFTTGADVTGHLRLGIGCLSDESGDITLSAVQLELGNKRTSYMPSTASTGMRSNPLPGGVDANPPDELIHTNLTNTEFPDWVAGAYLEGQIVQIGFIHYECIADTSDTPVGVDDEGVNANPPTWVDRGSTNVNNMFDYSLGIDDYTEMTGLIESSGSLDIAIQINKDSDLLCLYGLYGNSVNVYFRGEQQTVDISPDERTSKLIISTEGAGNLFITVTGIDLSANPGGFSGDLKSRIGKICKGTAYLPGVTEDKVQVKLQDLSKTEIDDYGRTQRTAGRQIDIAAYGIQVDTDNNPKVLYFMKQIDSIATAKCYVGHDDRLETSVYGYTDTFDLQSGVAVSNTMKLSAKGL